MPSTPDNLEIVPARSLPDFMFLRNLRNRVRHQMTNDTGRVGILQQLRFYLAKPRNVDIFVALLGGRRVGYLLLRHEKETTLITEAVDERFRGKGIGSAMVAFARRRYPDLTAEIRDDNVESLRLHEQQGFAVIGSRGIIRVCRYGGPTPARSSAAPAPRAEIHVDPHH